ncbi:alpha/beta fold hydrolase [Cupriavidus basilensis]
MTKARMNIVLVHGAWGDASHWREVIPLLHARGYHVAAVQNPLTGLADDIDRTSRLIAAQDGPTLLVGHSYGGAVITGAGHAPNVVGLVYVAAFAPDEGESLGSIFARQAPPPGAPISSLTRMASSGSIPKHSSKASVTTSATSMRS